MSGDVCIFLVEILHGIVFQGQQFFYFPVLAFGTFRDAKLLKPRALTFVANCLLFMWQAPAQLLKKRLEDRFEKTRNEPRTRAACHLAPFSAPRYNAKLEDKFQPLPSTPANRPSVSSQP